ncbi:MAG TPA: addiction module protein [Verrucomicrobiae bacterium]|nr:addiction module protein [Verrucomicrobiae bacterium]
MSATEILVQIRQLPLQEQREVFERLRDEFGDEELTPEQIAELDRRAEEALKHPERGRPAEEVFAEIEERLRAKK